MAKDNDPSLHLRIGEDSELVLTPENTSLYTHIGEAAMYDHVFVQTGEGEEQSTGMYIFRHNDAFQSIKKHMKRHRFPLHLNNQDVAACDADAFERVIERSTEDLEALGHVPEEWA
jgi:hypothetical protein